jgi:2-polyprenyl-6-methoxyphenol hydroxylase-like FAD-dependent oxidoreductase
LEPRGEYYRSFVHPPRLRVLIAGAGIAGSTLACLLGRAGHEVVVVERDQGVRSSGNPVDVRGPAFGVAERLGVLPRLREHATDVSVLVIVDRAGREVARLPTRRHPERELEIGRSDLCAALVEAGRGGADFRFDDSIAGMRQDAGGVDVSFERAEPERFDLVVGADGVHSSVRRAAFGPEGDFSRSLGMYVATVRGQVGVSRDAVLLHNEPGAATALHPAAGNPGAAFFFRSRQPIDVRDREATRRLLTEVYAGDVWRNREMLELYLAADDSYFDAVTRIRVPSWSRGRITLLGDAASSVSLFGEGSSAAMVGAALLSRALHLEAELSSALRRYERAQRRFARRGQRAAGLVSHLLVPGTAAGIAVRNRALSAAR